MHAITKIKCYLCEKDIKAGFYLEQGNILKNYPFYEMHLIHRDLSEQYNDGIKLMSAVSLCEQCFEKLLNKDIKMIGEENENESKSNN